MQQVEQPEAESEEINVVVYIVWKEFEGEP